MEPQPRQACASGSRSHPNRAGEACARSNRRSRGWSQLGRTRCSRPSSVVAATGHSLKLDLDEEFGLDETLIAGSLRETPTSGCAASSRSIASRGVRRQGLPARWIRSGSRPNGRRSTPEILRRLTAAGIDFVVIGGSRWSSSDTPDHARSGHRLRLRRREPGRARAPLGRDEGTTPRGRRRRLRARQEDASGDRAADAPHGVGLVRCPPSASGRAELFAAAAERRARHPRRLHRVRREPG